MNIEYMKSEIDRYKPALIEKGLEKQVDISEKIKEGMIGEEIATTMQYVYLKNIYQREVKE